MSDKLPLVFFKTIFDLLPEPILIIDKSNFKIKLCNIETQSLLEKSNEYLVNKELNQIFPNNNVLISNLIEMIKKSGNFIIKDKLQIKKNLFFEIKCVIPDEISDKFFIILKEVKIKNRSLETNMDHFNEIFSILSHEVNNPISSIKLASDLIKKKYTDVDAELLDIIKSEATRITRLFSNFNFSEFQNVTKKNSENIHEVIRLCLFKIKQMPNKFKIVEEFDPSLPLIGINKDLIIQVFDNLFINAYESSNCNNASFLKIQTRFIIGESIRIPTIKDDIRKNSIRIIISDNGIGISKELIGKIFLPFFSTKKRGSGIGLFLVKKIVDDHNGFIVIESKDGITSVEINLPF